MLLVFFLLLKVTCIDIIKEISRYTQKGVLSMFFDYLFPKYNPVPVSSKGSSQNTNSQTFGLTENRKKTRDFLQ